MYQEKEQGQMQQEEGQEELPKDLRILLLDWLCKVICIVLEMVDSTSIENKCMHLTFKKDYQIVTDNFNVDSNSWICGKLQSIVCTFSSTFHVLLDLDEKFDIFSVESKYLVCFSRRYFVVLLQKQLQMQTFLYLQIDLVFCP